MTVSRASSSDNLYLSKVQYLSSEVRQPLTPKFLIAQETEKAAIEDHENTNHLIERLGIRIKALENRQGKKIPVI